LVGVGLQHKTLEEVGPDVGLPVSQVLALFGKAVKRCATYFRTVEERDVEAELTSSSTKKLGGVLGSNKAVKKRSLEDDDAAGDNDDDEDMEEAGGKRDLKDEEAWDPVIGSLDDDLEGAGDEAIAKLKEKQREMINSLNLDQ
jgi:N-acetyltransferase 10